MLGGVDGLSDCRVSASAYRWIPLKFDGIGPSLRAMNQGKATWVQLSEKPGRNQHSLEQDTSDVNSCDEMQVLVMGLVVDVVMWDVRTSAGLAINPPTIWHDT